jgi:hypothetical protein
VIAQTSLFSPILKSNGRAHPYAAVKPVGLILPNTVDIQKAILFASVQSQFLSGTALADIRHLDLLQKYPLRTLVKLCGIAG